MGGPVDSTKTDDLEAILGAILSMLGRIKATGLEPVDEDTTLFSRLTMLIVGARGANFDKLRLGVTLEIDRSADGPEMDDATAMTSIGWLDPETPSTENNSEVRSVPLATFVEKITSETFTCDVDADFGDPALPS